MENEPIRVVFVTCPPDQGPELLRQLVEERLVACGNVVSGVRSVYRWKGEVCDEPEEVLLMETAASRVEAMTARLREIHPYEVPKILTFEPKEGTADYMAWVRDETQAGE